MSSSTSSTFTSAERAWRVLLSVAIVAGVPALAASHIFYVSAIASTFYPYVFASVVFIHLRMRFRWVDLGCIVLLGAAFALLDQFGAQGAKAEAYRGKKVNIAPQSIADFS